IVQSFLRIQLGLRPRLDEVRFTWLHPLAPFSHALSSMAYHHIPVFAFSIAIDAVVEDLRKRGFVVLVTTRVDAKRIAAAATRQLDINADDDREDRRFLHHLSFQGDDGGWDDCLWYTATSIYRLEQTEELTVRSVREWSTAGKPSYHIAQWRT
ncbi:hypothetical protein J7361_20045, partial [Xanthomonas phaseoli pv. dieffenbachiae]